MLAAKSFEKTSDPGELQRWLHILADELAGRMVTDAQLYRRHPRNLVLHYRYVLLGSILRFSRSGHDCVSIPHAEGQR